MSLGDIKKINKIHGKLSDVCLEESDFLHNGRDRILESLVAKGFAKFSNEENKNNGVVVTTKGMLMGEVIWECTNAPTIKNLVHYPHIRLIYSNWIVLGWLLVSSGIIFAISSVLEKLGLLDDVANTTKSFFHYDDFTDIWITAITVLFIIFVIDVIFISIFSFLRCFLKNHI